MGESTMMTSRRILILAAAIAGLLLALPEVRAGAVYSDPVGDTFGAGPIQPDIDEHRHRL